MNRNLGLGWNCNNRVGGLYIEIRFRIVNHKVSWGQINDFGASKLPKSQDINYYLHKPFLAPDRRNR